MDALLSSAQLWVPWVGVACLVLGQSWLAWLGDAGGGGARASAAAAGFFLSFALAIIAPVAAALAAWCLYGGLGLLGPIVLLVEPASASQAWLVAAWLTTPLIVALLARFILSSADGVAFGVAAAAALTAGNVFALPVMFAIAVAVGGLAAIALAALGEAATAIAACTAFVFIFAFAYAGGGQAVAVLALSVVGGFVLSLIAAGGRRARVPVFILLPVVPALGLAWLDGGARAFDLGAALPKPALGTEGALVLLLAVLPAIAAPFIWVPALIARKSAEHQSLARLLIEPVAILVELVLGVALAAALALALTAGAALYSHLHELGGGTGLVGVAALLQQIRPDPLAPGAWWIIALLALPLAPAAVHLFAFVTRLFLWVLGAIGLRAWFDSMIAETGLADRLLLIFILRKLQLVPGIAVVTLIAWAISAGVTHHADQLMPLVGTLFDACANVARIVEAW